MERHWVMWRDIKGDLRRRAHDMGFTAYLGVTASGIEIHVIGFGAEARKELDVTPYTVTGMGRYAVIALGFAARTLMRDARRAREELIAAESAALAMEAA